MTDITVTEQDWTSDKEKMDKDYAERNNGKDKDNENNETWAMVVSRRKKNGMDLRSGGNGELQKSQGKQARDHTDGRRDVGQSNETMKRIKSQSKYQRDYKKEATLTMTVNDPEKITMMMIIKAVEEKTGIGKLYGLRKKSNFDYELTMENEPDCDKLMDGLLLEGQFCEIKKLCKTERMVSFLHLPNYIKDEEIIKKLVDWGVNPILPLRRRFYQGTTVADGTRFLRVRFPKDIVTLPYNVRFDTEEGLKYFRVIHDDQLKTCRLCASTEHEKKDCPQYTCRECLEQGHFARDCQAPWCQSCEKIWMRCTCESEEEDNTEMEIEMQEHMEETSSDRRKDEIQEVNGISEDLHKQGKEDCTRREDNGDKEIEVHTTETETQQTISNNGQMKEKECATTSENAAARNKEEVSDEETIEMNFELESRTLDSMNRRRKMKKVAQINIEQVLKKQKLRKEAKTRLKDDSKGL